MTTHDALVVGTTTVVIASALVVNKIRKNFKNEKKRQEALFYGCNGIFNRILQDEFPNYHLT